MLPQTKEHPSTGAFFIQESEDDMGVRVVFPDMGKDPSIQLIEKTITENGTYDAITDGANGYSKVNVNVGGGGGSSDFSTANVTIVNNGSDRAIIKIPCCFESADTPFGFPFINYQTSPIDGGTSQTFKVALYKGKASLSSELSFEITGNITYNETYRMYIISGDCTISCVSIS